MTRKKNILVEDEVEEGKRCYSELCKCKSYLERFRYLKLDGEVGIETFGFERYLNQVFYKRCDEYKEAREQVIIRDTGLADYCGDMGDITHPIAGKIIVHHMNPITEQDILDRNPDIWNPEYLIAVSLRTHNAIHYGNESYILDKEFTERRPNDTCPWKH